MNDELKLDELISIFCDRLIESYSRQGQVVDVVETKVIAWYRERDARLWFADKAVCVAQTTGHECYTYAMGLFAKNPNLPNYMKWHPYRVTSINFTWLKLFNRPPSLDDAFVNYRMLFSESPKPGWERYASSGGCQA